MTNKLRALAESKGLEYWIVKNPHEPEILPLGVSLNSEFNYSRHVIEYSAYAEIKAREEKLESALDQILSSSHDSWTINLINEAMK